MIDVKNLKCECGKNPIYNFQGQKIPICCNDCKEEIMVDVKSPKCIYCSETASYNFHGQQRKYCSTHKSEQMIYNPMRRCVIRNCSKLAIYGINYPEYCEPHKNELKNSILCNINSKCKKCNLYLLLNENNICSYCSGVSLKKHELDMKCFLDNNDTPYSKYNKKIDGVYVPDFLFIRDLFLIILEIDEEQHKKYINELKRMISISKSQELPILFIRYNPDKYKCIKNQNMLNSDQRKNILLKQINYYLTKNINFPKLSVIYLFYDDFDIDNIEIKEIKI